MPRLNTLSFLGGSLTVSIEGHGPKDGEGTFAFPEDDAAWSHDDEAAPTRLVTVPLSELRELHTWLGKTIAQIDKSV